MRLITTMIFVFLIFTSFSGESVSDKQEENNVKWYTFEEALEMQKKEPRLLIIDMYTYWCGWCKRLDANTFEHPVIAEYLNTYFYPIKFNAEGNDVINLNGKEYSNPGYKPELARGRNSSHQLTKMMSVSSYPTVVFVNEENAVIQPIPGYRGPKEYEPIIAYFGMGYYKKMSWEDFQKEFKPKITAP